jgi:UDP-glucose 4-epimerase
MEIIMSQVVVIGGCGFIGSHIVDALLAAKMDVRVFDRRYEIFRAPLQNVDYQIGDVSDRVAIDKAINGVETVIHVAGTTNPSTSNEDYISDINCNLIEFLKLLEIMRSRKVKSLIYMSSGGAIYGIPQTIPVREDHQIKPLSSYGIVKAAVENYIHMESYLHDLQYCILRASNPYGPRQGHIGVQGVINTYLWKLSSGEKIEIWGNGEVIRDFIHIYDLASLFVSAIFSAKTGIFNAGSGKGVSISNLIKEISLATGKEIFPVYKNSRAVDVPHIELDIRSAKINFDWKPEISLSDGILETWNWINKVLIK